MFRHKTPVSIGVVPNSREHVEIGMSIMNRTCYMTKTPSRLALQYHSVSVWQISQLWTRNSNIIAVTTVDQPPGLECTFCACNCDWSAHHIEFSEHIMATMMKLAGSRPATSKSCPLAFSTKAVCCASPSFKSRRCLFEVRFSWSL